MMLLFFVVLFAAVVVAALVVVVGGRRQERLKELPLLFPVSSSPCATTTGLPRWWRGRSAVFVDVNNVRGALGFEVDLVAVCGLCCGVDAHLALFVDHGPRACAVECGTAAVCFAGKKAGPFPTADDMIVSAVGRCAKSGKTKITVVTSDRQLQRRCRYAALRFPDAALTVVPSQAMADWLATTTKDTAEEGGAAGNGRRKTPPHPFVCAFDDAAAAERDEWLQDAPRAKRRPPKRRLRNGGEGTPSRVDQAKGLYLRIARWLEKKEQQQSEKNDDDDSRPPWLQEILDRYPW